MAADKVWWWQTVSVVDLAVNKTGGRDTLEQAFAELKESHLRLQREHMRQMEEQVDAQASCSVF